MKIRKEIGGTLSAVGSVCNAQHIGPPGKMHKHENTSMGKHKQSNKILFSKDKKVTFL